MSALKTISQWSHGLQSTRAPAMTSAQDWLPSSVGAMPSGLIDASNDPEDRFNALGEAIATARMDHGIRIDLDPAPMIRGGKARADRAWAYGIATHPLKEGETKQYKTEIFFLKAVLSGHLGWDIEQYAAGHIDFPRRSTGDQFYDEWDFEAYRDLGYVLAESLTDHHRVKARLEDLGD